MHPSEALCWARPPHQLQLAPAAYSALRQPNPTGAPTPHDAPRQSRGRKQKTKTTQHQTQHSTKHTHNTAHTHTHTAHTTHTHTWTGWCLRPRKRSGLSVLTEPSFSPQHGTVHAHRGNRGRGPRRAQSPACCWRSSMCLLLRYCRPPPGRGAAPPAADARGLWRCRLGGSSGSGSGGGGSGSCCRTSRRGPTSSRHRRHSRGC